MPSPTQHFANLGADLRNRRWSWGATKNDGTVILRAWEDEIENINGVPHIRLTNHGVYRGGSHPGYRERLRHIEQMKQGAAGFIVICKAVKPKASNRRLKSFEEKKLSPVAAIVDHAGDQWARLGDDVPAAQLETS